MFNYWSTKNNYQKEEPEIARIDELGKTTLKKQKSKISDRCQQLLKKNLYKLYNCLTKIKIN